MAHRVPLVQWWQNSNAICLAPILLTGSNITHGGQASRSSAKCGAMANEVYDSIRREILAGHRPPSAALGQEEIAARLGVSRQPVRAALQQLVAEGWAVQAGLRGLVVASLRASDAEDLSLLRAEVESLALSLASSGLTKGVLGTAEDLHDRLAVEPDGAMRANLNWQLHRTLYAPCRRVLLLDEIDRLHRLGERYLAYQFNVVDNRRQSQREHAAILKACRSGDIEHARQLLKAHILEAGPPTGVAHRKPTGELVT